MSADLLFPLPPLRIELPDNIYDDVPECWWSRERWIAHNLTLYDTHYALLRTQNMVDSVSRKTFENYLIAESSGADFHTGRNARVSIKTLRADTSRSRSTVLRCRRLTNKFGTRTTVWRGRQRTKLEGLESWRRNDPGRGWTSVAALHESVVMPVDNSAVETLLDMGIGTPPGRSPGFAFISRGNGASSTKPVIEGSAPRCKDTKKVRRAEPAYDQRAVKLAAAMRRDERFPLWVREIPPGNLKATVTRKAVAGWDVHDTFGAFEEYRISGKKLITRPSRPAGYLHHVLSQIPDDLPPARLDRARTVAYDVAAHEEWRRELEQLREAAINAAGQDSPGRRQARAFLSELERGATDREAARTSRTHAARNELAQQARADR
jgi:hypothetical protein